jgi:hypothetical protein
MNSFGNSLGTVGAREGMEFQANLLALGAAIEPEPPGRSSQYRPAAEQVCQLAAQYVRRTGKESQSGSDSR